jgi:hypothetical protein
MSRHDMSTEPDCAARAGGFFFAGAMIRVAMLHTSGAIVRALHVSD